VSDEAHVIGWKPKSSDPRVASTRIRCLNPLRELNARGYPVELFNAQRSDGYRAVVYSKLYGEAEVQEATRLKNSGARIIFDLCDNHFHSPGNGAFEEHARTQIRRMMSIADHLVASTAALAEVMRTESGTSRDVEVIGDAVEATIDAAQQGAASHVLSRFDLGRLRHWLQAGKARNRTHLVWYGVHGGPNAPHGMLDLLGIRAVLESANRTHGVSLTVISNSRWKYLKTIRALDLPTFYMPWRPESFIEALRLHNLAVLPVSDNPFTRCKSNNRLALALSSGLPVVADSIPSYLEFANMCSLDDWQNGLTRYIESRDLREQHVREGQAMIVRRWSLTKIATDWQVFFDRVLQSGRR
jgi:hypothetical protein